MSCTLAACSVLEGALSYSRPTDRPRPPLSRRQLSPGLKDIHSTLLVPDLTNYAAIIRIGEMGEVGANQIVPDGMDGRSSLARFFRWSAARVNERTQSIQLGSIPTDRPTDRSATFMSMREGDQRSSGKRRETKPAAIVLIS